MALNALLDIDLRVPNPQELVDFWVRRGLSADDDGVLGSDDRPKQLTVSEGAYRHLSRMRLSCDTEQDLVDTKARLAAMDVDATIDGGSLTCVDPVLNHEVVIEVGDAPPLTTAQARTQNTPGSLGRANQRAEVVAEESSRAPRRLGHVVFGSADPGASTKFFVEGLGYKISDQIAGGVATFARCSSDHHNVLIVPGPTSYLNHYAMEMDDIDAVGKGGQDVLGERDDASVVGVGRHVVGSNVFWYLTDPSGNMFELFTDIDQITDDAKWEKENRRDDWGGEFAVWGPEAPEVFFNPADLDQIIAGREAAGL